MKNLLKTSMLALITLSLFAVSCSKEGDLDLKGFPPAIKLTVTRASFGGYPFFVTPNAELVRGFDGDTYEIKAETINDCYGTWGATVEAPDGTIDHSPRSPSNVFSFFPKARGTYKITITNWCDCGVSASVTLTIIVT